MWKWWVRPNGAGASVARILPQHKIYSEAFESRRESHFSVERTDRGRRDTRRQFVAETQLELKYSDINESESYLPISSPLKLRSSRQHSTIRMNYHVWKLFHRPLSPFRGRRQLGFCLLPIFCPTNTLTGNRRHHSGIREQPLKTASMSPTV